MIGESDWLAQRLLDQRVVALSGELDDGAANRAIAQFGLLELSGVTADLGVVLTLVDALDLMGAPVHATCLGTLAGPAVALLAVADRRAAGRHATLHLCEPRGPHGLPGRELETLAAEHGRQLRRLQERMAESCRRTADELAADMRAGKLLTADDAGEYGLVDRAEP